LTAADVAAARQARAIVRTWGPRGTLHLVAVDDLHWLLPLVGPLQTTHSLRRLAQEGVPGPAETAVAAVVRALGGQGPLTKAELGERLAQGGTAARGQGIVHLVRLAACRGLAVLGPDRGRDPTYVHAEDWLGAPIRMAPDRDAALAELTRRYLRAHGPAEPADLAAWSGLSLRDAEAGWRATPRGLTAVSHRGRTLWQGLWQDRAAAGGDVPASVTRLVPAFDEFLLGWRSRELSLPEPYRIRVHPGGGVLRPSLVDGGSIVATWSMRRTRRRVDISVVPFEPLRAGAEAALHAEASDVGRFLALQARLSLNSARR
ncbi:MAG: winged helix DNA-binding domain-containing protein, partial [Carbonactinosporaceae bacterium]